MLDDDSTTVQRPRWPAGAAASLVGVVLAAIAVVGVLVLVARDDVGQAPKPSNSNPWSPSVGAPSPSATSTATPASTRAPDAGQITRWAPTAEFLIDGFASEVRDTTYAAGNFIAVGDREPLEMRGAVGPRQDEALIWVSPSGASWEQIALGDAFGNAHLRSVVALPDGSSAIYGWVEGSGSQALSAWRSTDGHSWTPLEISIAAAQLPGKVVGGARGYLTTANSSTQAGIETVVWHSADGITWRSVRTFTSVTDGTQEYVVDYEAGAEGFVLTGATDDPNIEGLPAVAFVVASADGETWFEADPASTPRGTDLLVAPMAGDWMITTQDYEQPRTTTWFSANGLEWEERATIDIPVPARDDLSLGATTGRLASTGERFFITGSVTYCCHGPWWASGVWSSFDGRSWERLEFSDDTAIAGAASHDGVVVLAGFTGAAPETGETRWQARAAFWVGVHE